MSHLKDLYVTQVIPQLKETLGVSNVMALPRIKHVSINMGVGEAASDKKIVQSAFQDLAQIAGQKPVITKTRVSVAGFKIREGWPIGVKVTLRREAMYDFLQRLIWIAIPRVRDFRGYSVRSFDKRGNYSFGIREQIVFPEIDFDKIDVVRGMDITIATTAKNDYEAYCLLSAFRFPFRERQYPESLKPKQYQNRGAA